MQGSDSDSKFNASFGKQGPIVQAPDWWTQPTTITRWRDKNKPKGHREETTWGLFAGVFVRAPVVAHKGQLTGWSPATFDGDSREKPALPRVQTVGALVLDYEPPKENKAGEEGLTLDKITGIWAWTGHLTHASYSHRRPGKFGVPRNCFRTILPLSRRVTPAEHILLIRWAYTLAGLVDDSTNDACRLWFAPALRPGLEVIEAELHLADVILDPDAILASLPPPEPPKPYVPVVLEGSGDNPAYVQAALDNAVRDILQAPEGKRSDELGRVAFKIGRLVGAGGLGKNEARDTLLGATRSAGWSKPIKTESTLRRALEAGIQKPIAIPAPKGRRSPPPAPAGPAPAAPPALPAPAPEAPPSRPGKTPEQLRGEEILRAAARDAALIAANPHLELHREMLEGGAADELDDAEDDGPPESQPPSAESEEEAFEDDDEDEDDDEEETRADDGAVKEALEKFDQAVAHAVTIMIDKGHIPAAGGGAGGGGGGSTGGGGGGDDDERGKPKIDITVDLEGNVADACKALADRDDLYTRGMRLVQVLLDRSPHGQQVPVLREMPRPTLRGALATAATWRRWMPPPVSKWSDVLPSESIVQAVETRGAWPELRPIVGVAVTPFLRRDGSVCCRPGYDAASAYTLITSEKFPVVPEAPTREEAQAALARLVDLWCDFPFVDATHRHVPVAALLTMLSLPALGGANIPALLFEANAPGSGKTKAVDIACILALGHKSIKSAWRENEEMEKVLGSKALGGKPVLVFDNIPQRIPFGGSAIDAVLTCGGLYSPRILGKSESPDLHWSPLIMGTGNNITIEGDTRRRTLVCRQETTEEKPENRPAESFKYPELELEALMQRPHRVVDALLILRAHALAGRPTAGVRRLGSFEEWSLLVASAIAWAGGPNVLEAVPKAETSTDPTLAALAVLLEAWPTFDTTGHGILLSVLASKLYPQRHRDDEPEDDGLDHVREALEQLAPSKGGGRVRFDARRLGYVLRAHRGRVMGGRSFDDGAKSHGSTIWRVVRPGAPPPAAPEASPPAWVQEADPGLASPHNFFCP